MTSKLSPEITAPVYMAIGALKEASEQVGVATAGLDREWKVRTQMEQARCQAELLEALEAFGL